MDRAEVGKMHRHLCPGCVSEYGQRWDGRWDCIARDCALPETAPCGRHALKEYLLDPDNYITPPTEVLDD